MSAPSALARARAQQAARDAALEAVAAVSPFNAILGLAPERRGDELTVRMPYADHLIGNPVIPALHGGATGGFLEATAKMQLAWDELLEAIADDVKALSPEALAAKARPAPKLAKTVDFTVDYLRSGRPADAFARATVARRGRRVASVHVEAWQEAHDRPFVSARGQFLTGR